MQSKVALGTIKYAAHITDCVHWPLSLNSFSRRWSTYSAGLQLWFILEASTIYCCKRKMSWHRHDVASRLALPGKSRSSAKQACWTKAAGEVLHSGCYAWCCRCICSNKCRSWHSKRCGIETTSWLRQWSSGAKPVAEDSHFQLHMPAQSELRTFRAGVMTNPEQTIYVAEMLGRKHLTP